MADEAFAGRQDELARFAALPGELAACDRALELDPGNASAHHNRGNVLAALGRHTDALAAYDRALELDPGYADAHESKGIALAVTGDFDNALAELDTACHLAPDGAGEGRTWAAAILWHRGDAAGARERFALAAGQMAGCTPFRIAEMEAIALCGLGQPGDAERRLLAALPLRAPGDRPRPQSIYNLLCDPPLPGTDRLRAIATGEP